MAGYAYRVIPAPRRGLKGKGVGSGNDERFAHALEVTMNEMGRAGWDYVRADTLPSEERQGLTGRTTVYQNMLVFRRVLDAVAVAQPEPQAVAVPQLAAPVAAPSAAAAPLSAPPSFLRLNDPLPNAPPLGPAERHAAE